MAAVLMVSKYSKKAATEADTIFIETYGDHALSETICRD